MKTLSLLAALFYFTTAQAALAAANSHEPTPAERARARAVNQKFQALDHAKDAPDAIFRPVEDVADFRYVLFTATTEGQSEAANLRRAIAQNLPANVKLVVLATAREVATVRRTYGQWISADRLIVATDADAAGGFWARDYFPVPVYVDNKKNVGLM